MVDTIGSRYDTKTVYHEQTWTDSTKIQSAQDMTETAECVIRYYDTYYKELGPDIGDFDGDGKSEKIGLL